MRIETSDAGGALAWERDSVREDFALALPRSRLVRSAHTAGSPMLGKAA